MRAGVDVGVVGIEFCHDTIKKERPGRSFFIENPIPISCIQQVFLV